MIHALKEYYITTDVYDVLADMQAPTFVLFKQSAVQKLLTSQKPPMHTPLTMQLTTPLVMHLISTLQFKTPVSDNINADQSHLYACGLIVSCN